MAPRSSGPGEEATPLPGDGKHPVQRKFNTLPQGHSLWFLLALWVRLVGPIPRALSPPFNQRHRGPSRRSPFSPSLSATNTIHGFPRRKSLTPRWRRSKVRQEIGHCSAPKHELSIVSFLRVASARAGRNDWSRLLGIADRADPCRKNSRYSERTTCTGPSRPEGSKGESAR